MLTQPPTELELELGLSLAKVELELLAEVRGIGGFRGQPVIRSVLQYL